MHRTKIYMTEIIKKNNKEDMEKLEDFFYKLMCKVHMTDPNMTHWIKDEMKEMAYGHIISEEEAKQWIMNMKPCGQHWTLDETTAVMKSKGYNCDIINWYICLNMMYNDYYDEVKDNNDLCINLAYSFLNDKDSVEDKIYQYYKHIPKK